MKRNKNRKFQTETLESRDLMAGDVAVSLLSIGTDVVVIEGDGASNGVEVSTLEEGKFQIRGIETGGEQTTINGGHEAVVIDGDKLVMRLGDGDDVVNVPKLQLLGSVSVDTGNGDDKVQIGSQADEDSSDVLISAALDILLGDGHDEATVADTGAGSLRVLGGAENDEIQLSGVASFATNIQGQSGNDTIRSERVSSVFARYGAGDGHDTVDIADTEAVSLSVNLGSGDDRLSLFDTDAMFAYLNGSSGDDEVRTDMFMEASVRGFETFAGQI